MLTFYKKKYEEEILQSGLTELASSSKSYNFLAKEEDLYTVEDLKIKYK
jgi:hypothetical protein